MHKALMGLTVVLLLLVVFLSGCAGKTENTDEIDGGVRHHDDFDAPKVITSTQITSFSCEFSTLALMEESTLSNDVYYIEAVLEENVVKGSCESRETEKQTFETDGSFMAQLQEIVAKYDFAKDNGRDYHVSGLPDQFGAKLQITYESGEWIYASNNQDCFLELSAMEELWALFWEQIEP